MHSQHVLREKLSTTLCKVEFVAEHVVECLKRRLKSMRRVEDKSAESGPCLSQSRV